MAKKQTRKAPAPTKMKYIYAGSITEPDAQPINVQLNKDARLLTVMG